MTNWQKWILAGMVAGAILGFFSGYRTAMDRSRMPKVESPAPMVSPSALIAKMHNTIEDQQIEIMRLRSALQGASDVAEAKVVEANTAADTLRDEIVACREASVQMQNYIGAHPSVDPAVQQIAVALIKAVLVR